MSHRHWSATKLLKEQQLDQLQLISSIVHINILNIKNNMSLFEWSWQFFKNYCCKHCKHCNAVWNSYTATQKLHHGVRTYSKNSIIISKFQKGCVSHVQVHVEIISWVILMTQSDHKLNITWRFTIVSNKFVLVHSPETEHVCVY